MTTETELWQLRRRKLRRQKAQQTRARNKRHAEYDAARLAEKMRRAHEAARAFISREPVPEADDCAVCTHNPLRTQEERDGGVCNGCLDLVLEAVAAALGITTADPGFAARIRAISESTAP
jgi:hypothetical protein